MLIIEKNVSAVFCESPLFTVFYTFSLEEPDSRRRVRHRYPASTKPLCCSTCRRKSGIILLKFHWLSGNEFTAAHLYCLTNTWAQGDLCGVSAEIWRLPPSLILFQVAFFGRLGSQFSKLLPSLVAVIISVTCLKKNMFWFHTTLKDYNWCSVILNYCL